MAREARWPLKPENFESLVAHVYEGTSDRVAGPISGISDLDLALPVGPPAPKRARLNPSLRVPQPQLMAAVSSATVANTDRTMSMQTRASSAVSTSENLFSSARSTGPISASPASVTDADQNADTSNVDAAPLALGAQSLECMTVGHMDSYCPSYLSLGLSESVDDPVAAFAARTAATPLIAVADAAVSADAPVEADSVSRSESLLHRRIGDALMTGFVVDDENPLPWLVELADFKSRHEHNLPLMGPTAGAWNDQAYEDDQMDMSFNSELSALTSEVDQPETPAEAEADDSTTYALAGSSGELNEVMEAAVGATFDEVMGAPMDASWAVTAGEFRAAPGICHFLNVVVLMPEGRTVAIVCEQHEEWVKSPAHHVVTKHRGVNFPAELFDSFTIATSWQQLDFLFLALPFVPVHNGVRCLVSDKVVQHASSLSCCNSRHLSKSLVSVKVQRLGSGSFLKAVEVVSRGPAPVDPDTADALEKKTRAIAKARGAISVVARTNRRKVSPMYQKLNWYTDEELLSLALTSGLVRLFEVPNDVGDPARWTDGLESLLFELQVYCNKFSPRFHARTDYSIVTDRTMRRYAEGITRILNFVVNLVSRDDLDEHNVALPAGLVDAVDRLKLSQVTDTVFDLLQLVYAQKVDTKMNILRFMLKVFCVNPVTKSLRHPGELQAATSFVFRGGRLTVLILSAREVRYSCLTRPVAAASLPVVQSRDPIPPFSFVDEDLYDEDGYEFEPQVPSLAEVTQCSNHEEGNFSDAVARRCVILHDNQYPIPVEVAVIKNVSMEFTTPTTPNIFVPVATKVHLIIYKGVELDLSLLPTIVKQMKSFAAAKLRDLLYGFTCDLEISCFQDNWVSPAIQSTKADELCDDYFLHLLDSRKHHVVVVGDEITFSVDFAQAVLEKSALLEETFLALIHLTSGAPGRATELVDMRVTAHGDVQRNLFLAGREVYFAPNWSKNSGKCAPQQIYRFCDEDLSLLLLTHLMVIRPLLHAVAKQHVDEYNGKDFLELLFVRKGSSMNDHFFRATFVKTMTQFKFPILYNDMRHIFAYLCKLTVGGEGSGDLGELLRVIAGQFGNKPKTLLEVYGRIRKPIEINNQRFAECHAITNHFRAILKALETPEDFLDAFTATSALSGSLSAGSLTALNEIKLSVMKLGHKFDICIDDRASRSKLAQVEHGQHQLKSGRDLAQSDTKQLEDCRGQLDANDVAGTIIYPDSHFGRMEIIHNRRGLFDKQAAQSDAADSARFALNQLMPAASWKSDGQRVAVQRVLLPSGSNFLVVLPTTGGKSLLFQAYCVSYPLLLTVVFVPTVALQEGILLKVSDMQFDSSDTLDAESQGLVVLTFASLRNQMVRRILDELTGKSLSRIFIDEVHDLLMQHWNNPFEYLPQLSTRAQTVFMTATASRETRQALCEVFACGSAIAGVCEPTNRWNLRFQVRWIAGNTRATGVDVLRQAIDTLLSDLRRVVVLSKKAILFVSSQQSVDDVQNILNVLGIKSTWYKGADGVNQSASRRENATLWLAGVPVMVSTSAFSMGVDCADVTLVGVLECPYSIEQLAQMWGRAGRNGLAADCVLVLQNNLFWQKTIRRDPCKADVLDFALLGTCRQRCLATIFDVNCGPVEKPDCLDAPTAELCDNCESRPRVSSLASRSFGLMNDEQSERILGELRGLSGTHAVDVSDEVRQRALQLRGEVVVLATILPLYAGLCAICFGKTGQLSKHSYENCSNKKGICKFCFGAALDFAGDHETIACPFRKFVAGACVTCWCPLSVDNVGLHAGSPGYSCSAFNLKNWALQKLCQTEGLQQRSFWHHIDGYVINDKDRRQLILQFLSAAKLVVDPDVLHSTGDPVETEFDTDQAVHEVNHVVEQQADEVVDLDAI